MDDTGKVKRVTEAYLVDALSYTEAEARIHKEIAAYVSGDFQITNIAKSPIAEVFHYDDADVWYKCKVSYLDLDNESGKEKKISKNMVVTAHSVREASDRIDESLSSMLVDCETESVAKSNIIEIFPYIPGESEIPEGFVPVSEVDEASTTAFATLNEEMDDEEPSLEEELEEIEEEEVVEEEAGIEDEEELSEGNDDDDEDDDNDPDLDAIESQLD